MHRQQVYKPSWHGARPLTAKQQPRRLRPRSEGTAGDNGSAKDAFTEDVLARLRKAEAEAAALREQLQTATVASQVCAAGRCAAASVRGCTLLSRRSQDRQRRKLTLLMLQDEGGRKQPSRGGSRIDGSALRRETLFTSSEHRLLHMLYACMQMCRGIHNR